MKEKNKIICLIGESGSGKDTVAKRLSDHYGLKQLKSFTTRPPRYKDEDTHIFIHPNEVFLFSKNAVAFTTYQGHKYFATAEQVDKSDIYIIDVAGIKELKRRYKGDKEIIYVYLRTDILTRLWRMLKRGDSIISAIKRIKYDLKAFKHVGKYADYIVDNNNLAETTKIIDCIFQGIGNLDKYKIR